MKVILTFLIVGYVSVVINFIVKLWQAMPLKEEPSTPIYITKKLFQDE